MAIHLFPALSLNDLENMTLLEIDERVEFILEVQRDKDKYHLKDLSSIIFYGASYGFGVTQSKKIKESDFYRAIDQLLDIKYDNPEDSQNPEKKAEADLNRLFG